jgi:23S rRNA pseudouridine1911/1915/1917 synthase
MKIKIIYEDNDLLVINKPAGIIVFTAVPEGEPRQGRKENVKEKTVIDLLLEEYPDLKKAGSPPRYGIAHRLDKDTSGILLVAKNNKTLEFLQKQFKKREVIKKYLALVVGNLKTEQGVIETLIGRSPKDRKKQKVYLPYEPADEGKRTAITEYKVLEKFKDYNLLEVYPKTGRKHQIRTHLAYLGHPIAGDKMYGFKGQICPNNLKRQFLHASYLRASLKKGEEKEFRSELPKDLKEILNNLKP